MQSQAIMPNNLINNHPVQTLHNIDAAHIGRAIGLSFGVSQLVAIPALIVQITCLIFNVFKLMVLAIHLDWAKRNIANLTDIDRTIIDGLTAEIENTRLDLQLNIHRCFAAFLALNPGWGLVASAAFLHATIPSIKSGSAVERAAAAVSEHLLMGGIGLPFRSLINRLAVYPGVEPKEQFLAKIKLPHRQFVANALKRAAAETAQKLRDINSQKIQVPVNRGDGKKHSVKCYYSLADDNPANKTMMLFHGNAANGKSLINEATFYSNRGWNVLMLTMGGYGHSDEKIATSETSSIQDVEAVLKFVEQQGALTLGVHGVSIGGTLAMHATKLRPEAVKIAVLDKTLDNVPNVAANLVHNIGVPEGLVPAAVVRGIVGSTCPLGRAVPGVSGYYTDGNDNVRKAAHFKGVLVTIGGTKDSLMGRDKDVQGIYRNNFAMDIHNAHHVNNPHSIHCTINAQHNDSILKDPLAVASIEEGLDSV